MLAELAKLPDDDTIETLVTRARLESRRWALESELTDEPRFKAAFADKSQKWAETQLRARNSHADEVIERWEREKEQRARRRKLRATG